MSIQWPFVLLEVFRQSWWMRLYGGFTCKRTKAWSNSRWVFNLGMGKMSRAIRDSVTDRLAVSTTCAKTGRRGYHGSKKLKNSQFLDSSCSMCTCVGICIKGMSLNYICLVLALLCEVVATWAVASTLKNDLR